MDGKPDSHAAQELTVKIQTPLGSSPSVSLSFFFFFFHPSPFLTSSPSSSSSSSPLRAFAWHKNCPGATFLWSLLEGVRCYQR